MTRNAPTKNDCRLSGLLLALAACALMVCAPVQAQAQGSAPPESLFTLNAAGGKLTPVKGKVRTYRLTLRNPAARVVSFTDRPTRRAHTLRLRSFVGRWNSYGFGADPPNAVLELLDAKGAADVFVLSLARPYFHPGRRAVTFTAVHAPGQELGSQPLSSFEGRADRRLPVRFGRAAVFVDGGLNCGYYECVRAQVTNRSEGTLRNLRVTAGMAAGKVTGTGPSVLTTEQSGTWSGKATKIKGLFLTPGSDSQITITGDVFDGDDLFVGTTSISLYAPSGDRDNVVKLRYPRGWSYRVGGFYRRGNLDITIDFTHIDSGGTFSQLGSS